MTNEHYERSIGRLEGKLDLVISDQECAARARKQQFTRIEALERQNIELKRLLESIDDRLSKVEEPVSEFNVWRERGRGALMLIGFAAAAFGGFIATFAKKIWILLAG